MRRHQELVAHIAVRVQDFSLYQNPFRIYHGSTNSTRPSTKRLDQTIDTTSLSNILKVDTNTNTALVEPNVPMDKLVEATFQYGLIPPVVLEFPGITAGGGFAGTSGESSSFRHGFFENTVNWVEIVLPNRQVVTASNTDKPDLFHGAESSFGTLGVTTLLELRLIKAKTYVELTYYPVSSVHEAVQKIEEATKNPANDYLDSILFGRDRGVICAGRLINVLPPGSHIQRFTRARDPWFYLHAKDLVDNSEAVPTTETIPLVDYLFRYDRGGFWVGKLAFQYFMTPFNRFTRWALDKFLHTRVMYHALHQSGLSKQYIVQDVGIPYAAADEFVQYLDNNFGYYPLWLCPLHQAPQALQSPFSKFAAKGEPNGPQWLLNIGIWGIGPGDTDDFVAVNRQLESRVREVGGKKWLYGHNYYTEAEFWGIYERAGYDVLRAKYHATYIPSVFDKVKVDVGVEGKAKGFLGWVWALFWSIWPLTGLYGLFHAAIGGDYLLSKIKHEATKGLSVVD